jgi:hypothetical protein
MQIVVLQHADCCDVNVLVSGPGWCGYGVGVDVGVWVCGDAQVVPSSPWTPPAAARLPVDGVLAGDTQEAFQQFVGLDVKADLGDVDFTLPRFQTMITRMTNYALAAFLNCAHQAYPHVVMGSFRATVTDAQPLVKKLQHFLAAYPQLTGAGASADTTVMETGEMDAPTVRALQNLLNKCPSCQDFSTAVAAFRP